MLGFIYYKGFGVQIDLKKARLYFEKSSYQAQIFTNLLINRGFFKLTLNVIQENQQWIDKYYLPSSLMKYGDTLNLISEVDENKYVKIRKKKK